MEVYPGLIWVSNFWGPNSPLDAVTYKGLKPDVQRSMNAAVATSQDFGFFPGVQNYYNQPYALNELS